MGKSNLYAVCKPCVHTCMGDPCEAILNLLTLQAATELDEQEIRENIDDWLERVGSG